MSIVTKVAKMRLNFHATMLDVCNVANQLGDIKRRKSRSSDEKSYVKMF